MPKHVLIFNVTFVLSCCNGKTFKVIAYSFVKDLKNLDKFSKTYTIILFEGSILDSTYTDMFIATKNILS